MKSQTERSRPERWCPALVAVIALFGCGSPDSGVYEPPVAPEDAATVPLDVPAFDPTDAMSTAIQDEYRAQATYAKVLADLGDMTPFSNIVLAEGNHVAAIASLFTARSLAVPVSEWNHTNVPTFDTRLAACEAGVAAENANVAMYDGLLLLDLPDDVRTVFVNLRAASLGNHLPAFQKCF